MKHARFFRTLAALGCLAGLAAIATACTRQKPTEDASASSVSVNKSKPVNESVSAAEEKGYLIVSQYMPSDGSEDISDRLQQLIDENPNRTLFFPDGTYLIGKPILTPADPEKSVDLQLSNYAIIKAADSWNTSEAMIRLGAKDPKNDTHTPGSNYSLTGGILDGNGIASGVSIDGGRETKVQNVSMKNVRIGLYIKYGANSGSSDADISDLSIIGTGKRDSVGILLEGYDNTLTNIRIGYVFTGVILRSAGNSLRNIHPLYYSDYTDYADSCGFYDQKGNNWFDFCYSDHFAVGFRMASGCSSFFDNCFCMWWCGREGTHTVIRADGSFDSIMTNLRVGFYDAQTENVILTEGRSGGKGVLDRVIVRTDLPITGDAYLDYLTGDLFPG